MEGLTDSIRQWVRFRGSRHDQRAHHKL